MGSGRYSEKLSYKYTFDLSQETGISLTSSKETIKTILKLFQDKSSFCSLPVFIAQNQLQPLVSHSSFQGSFFKYLESSTLLDTSLKAALIICSEWEELELDSLLYWLMLES